MHNPRQLFGPWDARRAHQFHGKTIAFQVDGDPTWFTGVVHRAHTGPLKAFSSFPNGFVTPTSTDQGCPTCGFPWDIAWITRAVVLSDIS
jgi:hypothetical protein